MKSLIFSILTIISISTFGQMNVNEMIKIYKMDLDQFERYAVAKGYEFSNFKNSENINGIEYSKGRGKQTKYLTLYDQWFSDGIAVDYQTGIQSEIFSMKSELKTMGFKLNESYFMDDTEKTKVEKYRNNKFQFAIFTIPPNEENSSVWYEISFTKFQQLD